MLTNDVHVRMAGPITLNSSEPEPDIAVLLGDPANYYEHHPKSAEVFVIAELSHATLHKDNISKLKLYASEGIQEYWIVDIKERFVQVPSNS